MIKWFSNLKTTTKMILSFGLVQLMLLVVTLEANATASAMKASQEATFSIDLKSVEAAQQLSISRLKIVRRMRDAIIFVDPAKIDASMKEVHAGDKVLLQQVDELDRMVTDEASHRDITELKRIHDTWWPAVLAAVAASPRGKDDGDPDKMYAALDQSVLQGASMDARIQSIVDHARATAQARAATGALQFERNRMLGILTGLAVLLVGIVCTYLIHRVVSVPLRKSVTVLERVAGGDLSVRFEHHTRDEIGQMAVALNASLEAMVATLTSVQATSVDVSAVAAQLAASAQQISGGAQEQAASLEETAASLEEISSTVKQNTDNAQHAAQLASSSRESAERGGRVVEAAVSAMNEITKSSRKIADIITTIDEIAFQTNLLALNAAVEAARAGEQGRGFGVVAAEVRSLAQRTGGAAKEIRSLIADSSSKVEAGTHQVNQSGQTLDEIVKSVKRVTDMVAEIAAASREQMTGVEQVNTAVMQVDRVTQLNAAQTEELSATARSLSDKAEDLLSRVSRFELGSGTAAPAPARAPRPTPAAKRRALVAVPPIARAADAPAKLKVASGYEEF